MLGVCRLPWIELGLNEKHYEKFYSYVTGKEAKLEELLEKSNRVYTITRLINTKLGMSRKDDTLPYKVHSSPPLTGPNAGKVIDKDQFEKLLSLYYKKRGWTDDVLPKPGIENQFSD